jgi:hypothetical protein
MADAKKPAPPSGENGHTATYKLLFFCLILIFLSGLFVKFGVDSYLDNLNSNLKSGTAFSGGQNGNREDSSGLGSLFPQGEISLGQKIANRYQTEVRNQPAGQLLGLQKMGETGKVLEGPANKENIVWWRIDYKEAPDGWVKDGAISSHTGWFNLLNFFPWLFGVFQKFLILIGIIALILIVIVLMKRSSLQKLNDKKEELKKDMEKENEIPKNSKLEDEEDLPIPGLPIGEPPATVDVSNRRWKNVQSLINSHNLNDWRQAIIESDIMLDEMLDKMGYHGNSIGDKLKQIEPSDFLTLNQAWEAHKVRNQIAHKGGNYILSRDEAEKVIQLYSEVFKEFYYI